MGSRYIVTATPRLQKNALRELGQVAPDLKKPRHFRDGVFLVETELPARDFIEALVRKDPIFVKHIMPVQAEIVLTGQRETDLPVLLNNVREICDISIGDKFSVQCRRVGADYEYNAKDVEVFVGSSLENRGAVPVFSDTTVEADDSRKIVSVYLFSEAGYIGCSTARENLNEHCDEYRVFSRHAGREISRAEFKLKEAIRKFGLNIVPGRALDLGAAPGSWTKVLVDSGMQVVAIDPADLDETVACLPAVVHVRSRAEEYACEGTFDLLVNDMNVAPEESAETMVKMAPCLKPGAFAIMTAKLITRNPLRLLENMTPILETAYEVLRMKNLFHNRLEVTVLLKRKE
jgi:23S rRNA (cytidine2498-2'-O)-methyltransferase